MSKPQCLAIDHLAELIGARPPESVLFLHPDNMPLLEALIHRGQGLPLGGVPVHVSALAPRVDHEGQPCVYFLPGTFDLEFGDLETVA